MIEKINSAKHQKFFNAFVKWSIILTGLITILLALLWIFVV